MAVEESWSVEGVKVTVDDDNAQITKKSYGAPPRPDDWNVVRPLVNFDVKVGGGNPAVPITFIACYKAEDLSKVDGKANRLKLNYYSTDPDDPSKSKWKNIPITGDATVPSGFSGFAGAKKAMITASWPDPPVAWGDGG